MTKVPLLLLAALSAFLGSGEDDEAAIAAELVAHGESSDPARIHALAGLGTREALEGLQAALARMESVYMRREVLRAIGALVAGERTGERAVEVLEEALRGELDPHLRGAAVEALASVPHGRAALARVADDPEEHPAVRLEALGGIVRAPREDELAWLVRLSQAGRGRDEGLRGVAFRAAAPGLLPTALVKATKRRLSAVRVAALEELVARGDGRVEEVALRLFEEEDAPSAERLLAARTWLASQNDRVARRTLGEALEAGVPEELAMGIAETVAARGEEPLGRWLARELEEAEPRELRVLLRAARPLDGPALDEAFVAALGSEDPRVVREAAEGIGARGQLGASAALAALLEEDADGWLAAPALEALARLHPEPAWTARLVEATRDARAPVRAAALRGLRGRGGSAVVAALQGALGHPDWSTRLAAVRELEALATPAAVGALCARIDREEGRLREEIADALWRLTGEPWGNSGRAWQGWWEQVGEGFRVLTPLELARREEEREERLLRRTTRAAFCAEEGLRLARDLVGEEDSLFGLRVVSRNVVLALDSSVSMDEDLADPPEDGPRTRFELARQEILRLLRGMRPSTRFRLLAFAGYLELWSEVPRPATPEVVEDACAFVEELRTARGTNFYDALRVAFADERIDTIFVLSDGEPTNGDVTDPSTLRAVVREWNRFRGIVVHCIAIGPDLELLRGLAADSGGSYLRYR